MEESDREEVAGGVERPRDMERAIKYPEHAENALYRTGSLNDPPILWERCVNRTKGSTRARRIFRTVMQIH